MTLYLMRHGDAEFVSGGADAQRRLTDYGRMQVASMAAVVARAGAPKVIVSSMYLRALETAEIMGREMSGNVYVFPSPRLTPAAGNEDIASVILEHRDANTLLIVGHMPSMGTFAGSLLSPTTHLDLGTASVAAFQLYGMSGTLHGDLRWLLTPGLLS